MAHSPPMPVIEKRIKQNLETITLLGKLILIATKTNGAIKAIIAKTIAVFEINNLVILLVPMFSLSSC